MHEQHESIKKCGKKLEEIKTFLQELLQYNLYKLMLENNKVF